MNSHFAHKLKISVAIVSAFFAGTTMLYAQSDRSQPLSCQMVEAHGLHNFKLNTSSEATLATSPWDYVSGLIANAVLQTWLQYPCQLYYYEQVRDYADFSTSPDGDAITKIRKGERVNALGESNIDDLAAGKIFFELYRHEVSLGNFANAERYRNAANLIRNTLTKHHSRIPNGIEGAGGFYHKAKYPCQMWLDGLYMGPAVYAQWQHYFGLSEGTDANMSAWSDIANQFIILHNHTYDAEKQLNYHGWAAVPTSDDAFWARKDGPHKGCSPEFWGRGMGWYFGALVDILEYMPKNHKDYPVLVNNLNAVAAGLARWQDKKSGLWYQLLQYNDRVKGDGKGDVVDGNTYNIGTTANYLESSASCMYTYAFYKAIRLGLIPESYLAVADKAFNGIQKYFIFYDEKGDIGIKNVCASAGLGPSDDKSRTGTVNYYLCGKDTKITQNEGKAIGTFILAALEYEKRTNNK